MEAFYFLNVFKPKNITSFDVIYKLRKLLNIRQIGHSGTLDPMAEGVMQVGVGKATKLLDYLSSDKEYIAKIKFGYTSSTLDLEGEITKVKTFDTKPMTVEDVMLELKDSDKSFYVFNNSDTQETNVLFRLRDGNFGILEPEK